MYTVNVDIERGESMMSKVSRMVEDKNADIIMGLFSKHNGNELPKSKYFEEKIIY